ncbi:hypothetical protein CGZ95_08965 [Enemella evansiae]|uniref:helix-turn-helix domain-containing protein n=1 Tax=Enemella evansiae TaxID=2016499 RepID=UPI000B976844|nr:helix-turn-helix transcriptional regulator [Enemella evansiae]OYO00743.1 hypothetical protein CGZ95_08965 [Enemella evansiae]
MLQAQTLPEAVGSFVARTRREQGLTLDQVANAARTFGAQWSASSVRNIEKGQASLTLQTLILLALALGSFLEQPLRLSDLLGDAEALRLDGRTDLTREWFDRVLTGAEVRATPDDLAWMAALNAERSERTERKKPKRTEGAERNPSERAGKGTNERRFTQQAASLAEERAAHRLGIGVRQLQELALALWERSLEDESRRRAGEDSSPQARGRVTRVLVAEIRDHLDKRGRPGD